MQIDTFLQASELQAKMADVSRKIKILKGIEGATGYRLSLFLRDIDTGPINEQDSFLASHIRDFLIEEYQKRLLALEEAFKLL